MPIQTSSNKRTQKIKNRENVKGTGRKVPRDIVNVSTEKNIFNYGIKQHFRTADIKIHNSERDMEIIMNAGWVRKSFDAGDHILFGDIS
jgi:hypothetical protein